MKFIIFVILVIFWSFGLFEIGLKYFLNKFSITFFMFFSSIFLIITSILMIKVKKIKIEKIEKYLTFILLVYILYSSIGLLYTDAISFGYLKVLKQMYWFILFISTLFLLKFINFEKRYNVFILVGFFSYIILIILTLIDFFTLYDLATLLKGRWFGISVYSDRNVFMTILIYAIMLFSLFLLDTNKTTKFKYIIFFLCIMLITIISVLTGSRRIFVILLIIYISYFISFKKTRKKIFFLTFAIFIFISMYFNKIDTSEYNGSHSSIGRSLSIITNTQEFNNDGRESRLYMSFHLIEQYNILETIIGRGTSSYREYFIDYPHNFLISAFLEGGIIKVFILLGLITFIFYMLRIYRHTMQENEYFYILSTFLIFIFTRLISFSEFYSDRTLLILLLSYIVIFQKASRNNILLSKGNKYEK